MRACLNPSFKCTPFDLGFNEIVTETDGTNRPILNHVDLTENCEILKNMVH